MSHTRRFLPPLVVLYLTLSAGAHAQQQPRQDLYVDELVFTDAVGPTREYQGRYERDATGVSRAPLAPIVLWTRIVGTQAAVEDMRANGELPIKHKWFVSCGSGSRYDAKPQLIDEIPLEVGHGQTLDKLQLEVDQRAYFDWHTWSRKSNVRPCSYQVRVVDNRDRPLYCKELGGECVVDIELGN